MGSLTNHGEASGSERIDTMAFPPSLRGEHGTSIRDPAPVVEC